MEPKAKLATVFLIGFLSVSMSLFDISMAGDAQRHGSGEGSCPHEQTKQIPGSKIVFHEDSHDFGQIPYNRRVTHIFRFRNTGTEPLMLAKHLRSKVKEGC
jgi:hypothetical protein